MSIKIDNLADAVTDALKEYSTEISQNVKKSVKEVAKECVAEVKANSPIREGGGSYKKGWRQKITYDDFDDTRIIIHNKTDYQLTHLLEYGHAKMNGGRVKAYPHIAQAEQNASEKLMKKIKVVVKK